MHPKEPRPDELGPDLLARMHLHIMQSKAFDKVGKFSIHPPALRVNQILILIQQVSFLGAVLQGARAPELSDSEFRDALRLYATMHGYDDDELPEEDSE